MVDEYEAGMHRGRASRHGIAGKIRWLLLLSLVTNMFLLYKLWSNTSEISSLERRHSLIHANLVRMTAKQQESDQWASDFKMQTDACNKLLLESKNALRQCKESNTERINAASEKLKEALHDLEVIGNEKDNVNSKLETCLSDLNKVQEVTAKLQADIATKRQDEENRVPAAQPLHELEPKIEKQNGTTVDEIITDEEVAGNSAGKKKESDVLINCLFSEKLEVQEKCLDYADFKETGWEAGRTDFMGNSDKICLFVRGDSLATQSDSASFVFKPVLSSECLEISLSFFLVESSVMSVEDNGQVLVLSKNDEPGWKTQKLHFKQQPPHIIKITGNVTAGGGVGLESIKISKIECSPEGTENGVVTTKIDEDGDILENLIS